MTSYKTPNVYVEEISTFPPSVAEVSTAIPAFIGYTETGENLKNIPTRISSLLDYETLFGKAEATTYEVKTKINSTTKIEEITDISDPSTNYLMYYALRMYFDNGGGSCYIVSVGNYSTEDLKKEDFEAGLKALEKEDEPTLIVLTDAVNLAETDYYDLCQQVLEQCNKLKDRFAIFDVLPSANGVDNFRNQTGTEYLKYGAAYYPYLQTSLNYYYTEDSVTITKDTSNSSQEGEGVETTTNQATKLANSKTENTDLYNKIKTELGKQRITLPPSAAIAGVYASVDRERGV
ncbi:MAG: hypothetical protein QNJ53_30765, partial [Pleurocapsa sp. MO_192.B19]|nr:hypothetical protein [Pleurocapsa sp. MO_192.B19]